MLILCGLALACKLFCKLDDALNFHVYLFFN